MYQYNRRPLQYKNIQQFYILCFFLLKNVNNPFKELGLTCDLSQAPSCPTPAPISPIVGFPPFSKYSLKGLLTKFQVTSCMPDSQGLEMGAFVIFHFVRSSFVYDPFRFYQLFKQNYSFSELLLIFHFFRSHLTERFKQSFVQ